MKKLKKLADKPVIGPVIKKAIGVMANREVSSIASHFSTFLSPVITQSEDLAKVSFNIRHKVYCEELKFENLKPDEMETDEFDYRSIHCLIQHIESENYAGTVRIVTTSSEDEMLPIEKYCLDSIDHEIYHPHNFDRKRICEISRLAVPAEFRKRATDKFKGAATGVINQQTYSETELRCFPFIAIGLYLSSTSVLLERGISHVFVMMEPRLARSMQFVGIKFEKIGPVVDYHGKRAPYYIDPESLLNTLSPGFLIMLENIRSKTDGQARER